MYKNAQRIIKAAQRNVANAPIAFVIAIMIKDTMNTTAIIDIVVKKEIIKCLIWFIMCFLFYSI
jgi:hypothetical protein